MWCPDRFLDLSWKYLDHNQLNEFKNEHKAVKVFLKVLLRFLTTWNSELQIWQLLVSSLSQVLQELLPVIFLPEDYQFDSLLLLYVCTGLDSVYVVGLLLSKHSDPLFM